jgi:hypothetical protein
LTKENYHGFALQLPDVAKFGYRPNMKVENPFLIYFD